MGVAVSLFYWSLKLSPETPFAILTTLRIALFAAAVGYAMEGLGLVSIPKAAKLGGAAITLAISGSALCMALGELPNTTMEAALFIRGASALMFTLGPAGSFAAFLRAKSR